MKKQAKKASDKKRAIKTSDKKQAIKTSNKIQVTKTNDNIAKIYEYLLQSGEAKTKDITDFLRLNSQ